MHTCTGCLNSAILSQLFKQHPTPPQLQSPPIRVMSSNINSLNSCTHTPESVLHSVTSFQSGDEWVD